MSTQQPQVPDSRAAAGKALRGARRAAVIAIVVSLVVAAALGIVALLSGEFGELQVKVLLSTLLIAGFGITVLCHLAIAGRDVRLVGYLGIVVSTVAAVCGLALIWGGWGREGSPWNELGRAFGVLVVAALSLAQANLLLLVGRGHQAVRTILAATLAMIVAVAVLISLPLITDGRIPGPGAEATYFRLFGVAAILDALGTIVLPVVGRVLRREPTAALTLALPPEVAARLAHAASEAGTTPADLAVQLLTEAVPAVEASETIPT